MDVLHQSVLLDAPKGVDVVAIERELTQLWKQAASEDESSSPVVRACSLNFILVTEDQSGVDALADMVGEVTLEHPARIFLVVAERGSPVPAFEAWISARCSLPVPGGKQVCCEQITLNARGTDAGKIPSVITSLLVPDVPVVVLWMAKVDLNDSVLQSLVHIADRVMIDSSADMTPRGALEAWQQCINQSADKVSFGDLAWTHLCEWRAHLADAFQPSGLRSHLLELNTVNVKYSSTSHPKHSGLSQAFLLTGWLAWKLNWVLVHSFRHNGAGENSCKFRLNDQAINVTLALDDPHPGVPGGIESVSLKSNAGLDLILQITDHTYIEVLASIHGEGGGKKLALRKGQTEAQLLAQELEVLQRDVPYEDSLRSLIAMFSEDK